MTLLPVIMAQPYEVCSYGCLFGCQDSFACNFSGMTDIDFDCDYGCMTGCTDSLAHVTFLVRQL